MRDTTADLAAHSDSSEPDQNPQPAGKKGLRKVISGVLLAALLLILKFKGFLFLVFAKFRPFVVNPFEGFGLTQMIVTGVSMVVSVVVYAMRAGWWNFALGFVLVLFVHELGHAVAIRAKGLRAGAMVFIPFIGGAVTLKRQPRSVYVDAQIGLAGPIAGTLAALGSFLLFRWTGQEVYFYVAQAGFMLNLFNLTPITPLDGGRIAAAITKWMWVLGGVILFVMMVIWRNPLLIILVLLSLFQVYSAINREKLRRFYTISTPQRLTIAATYFELVLFLGYQTIVTHELRSVIESAAVGN
jgi:Zn-dependent protease